ncbi:MAG: DUF721 domain-containing protein [Zetaproteobacteria bacterium]|nr:MAG: DUF721 domain-containing protein [Zetaproteobacteria bacterium]
MKRAVRKRSHPKPLNDPLAEILGRDNLALLSATARLRRHWPAIVGTMMATRTEPVSLEQQPNKGLLLLVAVDHPIMAQQIRFLEREIRRACQQRLGIVGLRWIRTRMQPQAGMKSPRPSHVRGARVPWRIKRGIASELACVKDKRLRRAMFAARIAQYTNNPDSKEPA